MFQFPGFAPVLSTGDTIARAGLPHSEIRGLMSICLLPRLIAACHVLRRLREPRHPSCALLSFLFTFSLIFLIITESDNKQGRSFCIFSVFQYVNVLLKSLFKVFIVVPGRVELPTSTLSV